MRIPIPSLFLAPAVAVALTASFLAAPAAAPAQSDGVIYACVKTNPPGVGQIRIVGPTDACKSSETPLQWNVAPTVTATLTCPPGTTLFIGVCIENDSRPPAAQFDATDDCADEGRRLPSDGELKAFREVPGITLAAGGEWTDDLGDVTFSSSFVYAVVTDPGDHVREAGEATAYRCVAGPAVE